MRPAAFAAGPSHKGVKRKLQINFPVRGLFYFAICVSGSLGAFAFGLKLSRPSLDTISVMAWTASFLAVTLSVSIDALDYSSLRLPMR